MNNKMKMIAGMTLVLAVVSAAFLATPIQAYVNGTGNGDLLQTQDRDRLQTQDQDRLRTMDCNCTCDYTCTQYCNRQRTNECATNRICNCTMSLEQHRNQNRQRTRSQGPWWVCKCYARHCIRLSLVMGPKQTPHFFVLQTHNRESVTLIHVFCVKWYTHWYRTSAKSSVH